MQMKLISYERVVFLGLDLDLKSYAHECFTASSVAYFWNELYLLENSGGALDLNSFLTRNYNNSAAFYSVLFVFSSYYPCVKL